MVSALHYGHLKLRSLLVTNHNRAHKQALNPLLILRCFWKYSLNRRTIFSSFVLGDWLLLTIILTQQIVLMLIAAIFAIILSTFCLLGTRYGLGEHIWNLSTDPSIFLAKAKGITQSLYGGYLSYASAISFTKCSIIASYRRVFPGKVFRCIIIVTGLVTAALWLCSVFTIIFECNPVEAAWDWTIKDAQCIDIVKYMIVNSSVNVVTDIMLCLAPIPLLMKIHMPMGQRLIVCILFGFGAL